jgi:hypothetical protein
VLKKARLVLGSHCTRSDKPLTSNRQRWCTVARKLDDGSCVRAADFLIDVACVLCNNIPHARPQQQQSRLR